MNIWVIDGVLNTHSYTFLCGHIFPFFQTQSLMAGSLGNLTLNIWETDKLFSQSCCTILYSSSAMSEGLATFNQMLNKLYNYREISYF